MRIKERLVSDSRSGRDDDRRREGGKEGGRGSKGEERQGEHEKDSARWRHELGSITDATPATSLMPVKIRVSGIKLIADMPPPILHTYDGVDGGGNSRVSSFQSSPHLRNTGRSSPRIADTPSIPTPSLPKSPDIVVLLRSKPSAPRELKG